MPEIIKVTTPINIKDKVKPISREHPNTVFDMQKLAEEIKEAGKKQLNQGVSNSQQEGQVAKQTDQSQRELIDNLRKEILKPLTEPTTVQINRVRALMAMVKLMGGSAGPVTEGFLEQFFIQPQDMKNWLSAKEAGQTPFRGEAFEILKSLQGLPEAEGAIASVLRHFDAMINRENSLKAIMSQGLALMDVLFKADKQVLGQFLTRLDNLMAAYETGNQMAAESSELPQFLKQELIPILSSLVGKYQQNDLIRNPVMSIIHYIVRFDKGDPKLLNQAITELEGLLRSGAGFSEEELLTLRSMVFDTAEEMQFLAKSGETDEFSLQKFGIRQEDHDLATLALRAMGQEAPPKLHTLASGLMSALIQDESPVMQLLHFLVPVREDDANVYVEFFIDKDAEERKEDASEEAQSVFFTIESDEYGTFEVDLLARDTKIDLNIKCPAELIEAVKGVRPELNREIADQGYQLTGYNVKKYKKETTIAGRFPKLAQRKVGIDVKV